MLFEMSELLVHQDTGSVTIETKLQKKAGVMPTSLHDRTGCAPQLARPR